MSQSSSPKKIIKYSNSSKSVISNQVVDENMLMLNFINQDDIFPKKPISLKTNSPSFKNLKKAEIDSFYREIPTIISPEKCKEKVNDIFSSESYEDKLYRTKEKEVSSMFTSSFSNLNNISNIDCYYDKKIASLNQTILKLNETVEKYIRKISSLEKEIQFINKCLREAENLNIKMLGDLSNKNQIIESLNIQINSNNEENKFHRQKSKKEKEINLFQSNFDTTSEIFMKSISELFLKELMSLNIKPSNGNTKFDTLFEDVKIKFQSKKTIDENDEGSKNLIELRISDDLYLKNLLKVFILNSEKYKKFNSMKIIKSQYLSTFASCISNLFSDDDKATINNENKVEGEL